MTLPKLCVALFISITSSNVLGAQDSLDQEANIAFVRNYLDLLVSEIKNKNIGIDKYGMPYINSSNNKFTPFVSSESRDVISDIYKCAWEINIPAVSHYEIINAYGPFVIARTFNNLAGAEYRYEGEYVFRVIIENNKLQFLGAARAERNTTIGKYNCYIDPWIASRIEKPKYFNSDGSKR